VARAPARGRSVRRAAASPPIASSTDALRQHGTDSWKKPNIHSQFNKAEGVTSLGMTLLPFKSKIKGPAPPAADGADDIIDEAIMLFRANVLFASFDVEGPADRVLVYATLYISQCLTRLDAKGKNKAEGLKIMTELARESFALPGESGWMLGGHFPTPKSRAEADQARAYLKHFREELGTRLVECVYNADGSPNKFWMAYSKRKFMNIPIS